MCLDVQGPDNDENKEERRNACLITSDLVDGSWPFFSPMHSVMEAIKATSPDGGAKSRRSPEYTCKCPLCVCVCVCMLCLGSIKSCFWVMKILSDEAFTDDL